MKKERFLGVLIGGADYAAVGAAIKRMAVRLERDRLLASAIKKD